MAPQKIIAVLTGDLIRSRKASPDRVAATFSLLEEAATAFGAARDMDLRFTRFRGDGWQIALTQPGLCLDALLYLVAVLRAGNHGLGTRISIGIGRCETLGTTDLSDASGTAFFISGNHLDRMSPKRQFALAGTGIGAADIGLLDLAEFIIAGWTPAQAEAFAKMLLSSETQETLAAKLGITRQAVQSRLSGAGFSYFENALSAIRTKDFSEPADRP